MKKARVLEGFDTYDAGDCADTPLWLGVFAFVLIAVLPVTTALLAGRPRLAVAVAAGVLLPRLLWREEAAGGSAARNTALLAVYSNLVYICGFASPLFVAR